MFFNQNLNTSQDLKHIVRNGSLFSRKNE